MTESADTGAMLSALQAQNVALRQLVSIHDRLGALVLQGADIGAVTRMLSDLVGRRVLLLDALLQVIAMAPADDRFEWAPRQGYVRAVLATLARERRPLRIPPMTDFGVDASCVLAPVALGDAILGYLALLAESDERVGPGDDVDLQIVQHAANVYALSMMRERMAAEVSRQLKDELFEGLLSGRPQDETVARERAMRLGYSPDLVYRVLVLVVQSPSQLADDQPEILAQRRRLLESLAELAARRSAEAFATLRDDELVVLMPDADDGRELGQHAVRHSAALGPDWRVTVAIGGPASTASAIAASYAQARRALEVAQRFYPAGYGDIVAFEDLGLYRLLFHVDDPAELRGFTEQVLGALLEYDQRHNADFVRTLAAFLGNNGNLQATARELNLHVNSVGYRLQRIQAIARLDLERSDDRLLAQVALKILSGIAA
ncbi:MAG: helix-turn-helix domain-containing protein [Chloroflexi bacterium]|nr:helix-turn-helix domain-containing protein [Chloroflexota bacterium]